MFKTSVSGKLNIRRIKNKSLSSHKLDIFTVKGNVKKESFPMEKSVPSLLKKLL